MKIDRQIPIGKAVEDEPLDDDAEVTGHGLVFDTGEPATSVSAESKETGPDAEPGADGQRLMPDTE